jgi:NAD(P)-dependent dehydrogenase (short-subunit alcohol dehydrogenase family)
MTLSPHPLANKTVVLLGGTGGIGLAIAELLAQAGARIAVVASRDPAKAQAIAVTFDRILQVNTRASFSAIRAFAPQLRARGEGLVVQISSIAATTAVGSNIAYCAAKAGMDVMGMALARALAPQIRVLSVAPGVVDTDFVPGRDQAAREKTAATTPLKRLCTPPRPNSRPICRSLPSRSPIAPWQPDRRALRLFTSTYATLKPGPPRWTWTCIAKPSRASAPAHQS